MKKFLFSAVTILLGACSLMLSSCDNDDEPETVTPPVVTLAEVGEEDSKLATAGDDLHLEGELLAEGQIGKIELTITTADGQADILSQSWTEGKYIGVRNTVFHEHVDIPEDTPAGDYKLTLTVTDKIGQRGSATSDLTINVLSQDAPQIDITEVGADNSKTAVAGSDMHLEAEISAPKKISEIEVELHTTAAGYEKVFTFTDKYSGETSAHFHEHLEIPSDAPAGEYHIHFTVTDAEGNSVTEEVEGVLLTSK